MRAVAGNSAGSVIQYRAYGQIIKGQMRGTDILPSHALICSLYDAQPLSAMQDSTVIISKKRFIEYTLIERDNPDERI
jgi:hypothetical protein